MKVYMYILTMMITILASCGKRELKTDADSVVGLWEIYSPGHSGVVEFGRDDTFVMSTVNGDVTDGNFVTDDEGSLYIIYAMCDDIDIMTEEDYENGWRCSYYIDSAGNCHIGNLPFYRDKTVTLERKE